MIGIKSWVFEDGDSTIDVRIWSSSDGIAWNQEVTNPFPDGDAKYQGLEYDSNIWLIFRDEVGTNIHAYSSSNGTAWTEATTDIGIPSRSDFSALVHDGKMWIIASCLHISGNCTTYYRDAWYSSDGVKMSGYHLTS